MNTVKSKFKNPDRHIEQLKNEIIELHGEIVAMNTVIDNQRAAMDLKNATINRMRLVLNEIVGIAPVVAGNKERTFQVTSNTQPLNRLTVGTKVMLTGEVTRRVESRDLKGSAKITIAYRHVYGDK